MNWIYGVIGLPVLLFFTFLTGTLVRAVILKEDQSKGGLGSIIWSLIVGGITIVIIGTVFKACGGNLNDVIKE